MISISKHLIITLLALSLSTLWVPDLLAKESKKESQTGKMSQVKDLYKKGQYKEALNLISSMPQSDMTHYYSGLSYHGLNQTSKAHQEYYWVATRSKNPTLRQHATQAIQNLTAYKNSRTYSGNGNVYARYSVNKPPPPKPKAPVVRRG